MDVLAVFFPSCLLIPELGLDNSEFCFLSAWNFGTWKRLSLSHVRRRISRGRTTSHAGPLWGAAGLWGLAQGFSLRILGFWDFGISSQGWDPSLSHTVTPEPGNRDFLRCQQWEQGRRSLQHHPAGKGSDPKFQPGAGLGKDKSRISPDPHRALSHLT